MYRTTLWLTLTILLVAATGCSGSKEATQTSAPITRVHKNTNLYLETRLYDETAKLEVIVLHADSTIAQHAIVTTLPSSVVRKTDSEGKTVLDKGLHLGLVYDVVAEIPGTDSIAVLNDFKISGTQKIELLLEEFIPDTSLVTIERVEVSQEPEKGIKEITKSQESISGHTRGNCNNIRGLIAPGSC